MYLSTFRLCQMLAAQFLLIAVAVGFTKPSSITIRTAGLVCTISLMTATVISQKDNCDTLTKMYLHYTPPGLVFQYLNIVLLRRREFDFLRSGPQSRKGDKEQTQRQLPTPDTAFSRLAFGLQAASGRRYCGQSIEINNVPKFRKSDPAFVPSRRRFLVERGLLLFVSYLSMDFLSTLEQLKGDETPTSTAPTLLGSASDFTAERVAERFSIAVIVWVFSTLSTGLHFALPGYVLVFLGLAEPKSWRPVVNFEHGMPYSIRRLWSHYWHLCNKDIFYQPAKSIADDLLHLRKGSAVRRYTVIVWTFIFSGVLHFILDISSEVPFAQSRSMHFFVIQGLAILYEDAVAYAWVALTGQSSGPPTRRQRWIGRFWVVLVMYWTTLPWIWPITQYRADGGGVPFSVIKGLQAWSQSSPIKHD